MSDLREFIQSKAGLEFLRDIHRIAEAVDRRTIAAVEKLVETPAALPDHLAEVCADRTKLHNLLETTKDWAFTRITPFYSQSYCFRQAQNGFYHFVGVLMGHSPDQIFAVTIMGDCGSDTYRCSEGLPLRQSASWMAQSYPDYLLSKGTHKAEFRAHKAREHMKAFFKEHADQWDDSERPGGPLTKPLWEQYGQNVDALLANACANTTDLYNLVQEAADDLDVDTDVCDRFKEYMTTDFFDHEWGMDYDAMDYARIEQMRWFGLWLLEHHQEVK